MSSLISASGSPESSDRRRRRMAARTGALISCRWGLAAATSAARPSAEAGGWRADKLGQQEFRERHRGIQQPLECRLAALAHEIVGILAVRQEQEHRVLAVGEHRQRVLERAPRGLAPGAVAVEAEHDGVGLAKELLRVRRRGGGAQRSDRIVDAVLGQRDDIHVALDDDHLAGVANRVARKIEAVEFASLREHRRFRRVEILGFARAHHAPAEADHAAAGVVDGKHDAVAEAVVALAAVAVDHESGGIELRVVVLREDALQALPLVRCVADAEARGDLAGEAAALQVLDRARRILQLSRDRTWPRRGESR